MHTRLIAAFVETSTRWMGHAYVLSGALHGVIAIACGLNNLSFGLVALGCEALATVFHEAASKLRAAPVALPSDVPAGELLSA